MITGFPFQLVRLNQNHIVILMKRKSVFYLHFIPVSTEKRKHRLIVWDLWFIYLFLNLWFLDLLGTIEEILPRIPEGISVWAMSDSVPRGVISLKEKLRTASDKPVARSHLVASSLRSTHVYIFTSGTTGMIPFILRIKKKATYLQSNRSHHGYSANIWKSMHPRSPEALRS